MALYARNKVWWIGFTYNGKRIQRTTGTSNKAAAQELHDRLKADLWRRSKLKERPQRLWQEAVIRWLNEATYKRSLDTDKFHLDWVCPYLKDKKLSEIDGDLLEDIAREKEKEGVAPATVNRLLAVLRAILKKAEEKWKWIEKAPFVEMRRLGEKRERWLTRGEAQSLLQVLPSHLADLAAFSLATGLRKKNVTGLCWQDIDLVKRHAFVRAAQSKSKKAIPVPLNSEAVAIIKKQIGKHSKFVFTYKSNPIEQCNTKAWRKALKRIGIENFRWHDLRHTWASWHVQNGTSLQELQQLGGWASFDMVLRYAHLSSDHLKDAAERIVTNSLQCSGTA